MAKNQTASPRKIPAKTCSKDHTPYYFGHFINQGRHNAYMILADIARRFEVAEAEEEKLHTAPVLALLDERGQPDITARLVRELQRHFTFLRYLNIDPESGMHTREAKPKEVKAVLAAALLLLLRLRNTYSHFGHGAPWLWTIGGSKPFPLIGIYQAAVLSLRPRYSYYTEAHIGCLLPKTENAANTPNNPASEPYNERALTFFACLFLERDEVTHLISRLQGFESSAELSRRALLDAYREFACRLPHDKLESSDVLLDMFNELGRCPGPLYEALSEADRKRFDRTPEPDEEDGLEPEDLVPSLLIRHKDRFPWFALRYFDDQEVFPTLRFHIHLGKFAEDRYLKTINAVQRERSLLQPIRVFTLWKKVDVTDLRRRLETLTDEQEKSTLLGQLPASWLVLENGLNQMRSEVDQFATRYVLDGNCIGVRFVGPSEPQGFPELATVKNEKGRLKFEPADRQPHALLSTRELPALFLHQRLLGAEKTETTIRDFIKRFKAYCAAMRTGSVKPLFDKPKVKKTPRKLPQEPEQLRDIEEDLILKRKRSEQADQWLAEHYGLRLRQLPDPYREYLLGYWQDAYWYQALQKLKAKRTETRRLLKDIGHVAVAVMGLKHNAPNDPKEQKLHSPRSGEMGVYLARDIVFLKPYDSNKGGKPNDQEFVDLEEMLALYGGYRNKIGPYFRELGLTSGPKETQHPFLRKINVEQCQGILDFYGKYLVERLNYLENAVKRISKAHKGISEEEIEKEYGHILRIKRKEIEQWEYTKGAIFLPRGLFNPEIETVLRDNKKNESVPDAGLNIVAATSAYVAGDTQPMYGWDRYVLPPGRTGERGQPVPQAEQLVVLTAQLSKANEEDRRKLRRQEKYILDRDQELRYIQTQDRALWLMALDRANKSTDWHIDFSGLGLRDIEEVLTKPIELEKQFGNVQLVAPLTIRRYGELRRLLKDRRITPLLRHFTKPETIVEYDDLKAALDLYDRRRVRFFEHVYLFEQRVYECYQTAVDARFHKRDRPGKPNYFNHWDYLTPAFEQLPPGSGVGIEREQLGDIRKKLLHNEVPSPEMFHLSLVSGSCKELVNAIFDQAEGYYNTVLRLLRLPSIVKER